ncbi:MAG: AEC family transporter [Rhizomicrobium sp.]
MMIASALVPVFFVMALGYFSGKRGIVDNVNIKSLNMFLMNFALPAALFTAIARTPRDVIMQNASQMAVLAISLLVIFIITALIQYKAFKLNQADGAVQTLTIAFPNFASIGLPLLVGIYGTQAALPVAIAIATGSVTISPLTLTLLELSKQTDKNKPKILQFFGALKKSVSKPIFIAPLLAVILALSGVVLPELAYKSFNLIGQATAGAGLFLTGLILSAQPIRITGNVAVGVLLKNIIQPLIAALVVYLLHVPQPMASEVVLLIAIPAGFFGLVFGAGYGSRPAVAGSTLVASSLFSIITLAVAIALVAPH